MAPDHSHDGLAGLKQIREQHLPKMAMGAAAAWRVRALLVACLVALAVLATTVSAVVATSESCDDCSQTCNENGYCDDIGCDYDEGCDDGCDYDSGCDESCGCNEAGCDGSSCDADGSVNAALFMLFCFAPPHMILRRAVCCPLPRRGR